LISTQLATVVVAAPVNASSSRNAAYELAKLRGKSLVHRVKGFRRALKDTLA
jgi:hypothetical protein